MTPLCVLSWLGKPDWQVVRLDGRTLHASIKDGRISVYHAADLSTSPLRPACFPRYFLNLCYDWSLCLAPSLLLMVWLRCRFIQAAIALFIRFSLPSLCCFACRGLPCPCILLSLFILFILRFHHNPSSLCSACHHFVRHHSPALHPVFQQLVHTARSIVTPRRPGGSSGIHP